MGREPARRNKGQSLTELALFLPVFLLITVGIIDGARIFSSWISLTSAVREGALYASYDLKFNYWCMDPGSAPADSVACPAGAVEAQAHEEDCGLVAGDPPGNWCPDPDNIAYRIRVEATGLTVSGITLLPPACTTDLDVGIACTDSAAENVTVVATYEMNLITPVIGNVIANPVQMRAAATAPIFR